MGRDALVSSIARGHVQYLAPELEGSSQLYAPVPTSRDEKLQRRARIHRSDQICEESRALWFDPQCELDEGHMTQLSERADT